MSGLKIAYADYVSNFDDLLIKDDSVEIQQQIMKVLVTEICKISRSIAPRFMNDLVKEFDTRYPHVMV